MLPRYVCWPTPLERAEIKERFMEYSGFPGIVGCIDGSYCNVTSPVVPLLQKRKFVNRHHQSSFNILVVCDHTLLVRYAHIGEVGSMHDQRVMRRSNIYQKLVANDDENFLCDDEHIVGDSAYTLLDSVSIRNIKSD
jgi:hypothetical protein